MSKQEKRSQMYSQIISEQFNQVFSDVPRSFDGSAHTEEGKIDLHSVVGLMMTTDLVDVVSLTRQQCELDSFPPIIFGQAASDRSHLDVEAFNIAMNIGVALPPSNVGQTVFSLVGEVCNTTVSRLARYVPESVDKSEALSDVGIILSAFYESYPQEALARASFITVNEAIYDPDVRGMLSAFLADIDKSLAFTQASTSYLAQIRGNLSRYS